MKSVHKICLFLVMALLTLPVLQQWLPVFTTAPLSGVFIQTPDPILTDSSWLSGEYQAAKSKQIEENIGFRPDLVRLFNQVDFSLFGIAHAERIIVGRDGYLMAQHYMDAYFGHDYIGESLIREKVHQFVQIQEMLWNEKHQLLVLVFPPDKGTFYPEFIPGRYLKKPRAETNYLKYKEWLVRSGANFIDFNSYFLRLKDSSRYMLYPKTGIHWSNYGAMLAADSLTRYIETKMDLRLPRIILDSMIVSESLRPPDGDMGVTMNLIWNISHPAMAYPVFHFDTARGRKKVNALVVGDSFYRNWYNLGYIRGTFENENFWYYNNDAYPEHFTKPTSVWDIDRKAVIEQADVILILLVNAGYGNIGYGFLEELSSYLGMEDSRLQEVLESMRNTPEWMNVLEKKAGERGIRLDEMMMIDARYMVDQQLKQQKQ